MDVRGAVLLALVACSGSKTKEDAHHPPAPEPVVARDAAAVPVDGKGDVQIRVEWKDVPVPARASPGRTPCGTARPGAVTPTTTWGIPDVIVALDTPGTIDRPAPRISLEDCALTPRVALAGSKILVASAADAPATTVLQRTGELPLGAPGTAEQKRTIYLPIAGHEVEATLEPRSVYRLDLDADDVAWIVATDSPFFAITDASGQAVLRDVPAGPHAVTAWLPPRAGQDARLARGTVTVAPSGLAEVTLDLGKP